MAGQSNVIELVFKLTDQVSKPLSALRQKLGGALAFGAGIAGVTGLASATLKVISATREAQDALVKFDTAFRNLGATSGKTREQLLRFAQDASKSTIFDDESILRAQAALLKFQSISGATFDRARQAAVDLASAMGTDIESAAETVGRALERPEVGLRNLRAAGVLFTADQEKMIRALVKTGDTATAAEIVLARLEKQFKGAGDAASNTLSGALARTKTAFDNLFEGSEADTKKLTGAVDGLADTLNSAEVKNGIRLIVTGLASMVSWAVKAAAAFGRMGDAIADALVNDEVPTALQQLRGELAKMQIALRASEQRGVLENGAGGLAEQRAYIETLKKRIELLKEAQTIGASRTNRRGGDRGSPVSDLDTSIIADEELLKRGKEFSDALLTPFEKYEKAVAEADALLAAHVITTDTWVRALGAARAELNSTAATVSSVGERIRTLDEQIEDGLREFRSNNVDEIERSLKESVSGLEKFAEQAKGVFDTLADYVSSALERMLNNGKFTWRELGEYLLRELASGFLKKALDALKKALKDAFSGANFGGGVFGKVLGGLGSLFGGNAGGGLTTIGGGPRWVGEEGPELAIPTGSTRIFNQRQLASMGGMGGGGKVSIGGTVIHVGGDVSDKNMSLMREYVDVANARQARLFSQLLQANGLNLAG